MTPEEKEDLIKTRKKFKKNNARHFEYFKQQLNQKLSEIKVDDWVRYITVDKDGAVWSFSVTNLLF